MAKINFEKIVPWNGTNDTGNDARLKLERNFDKIATSIDILETNSPKNLNVSILSSNQKIVSPSSVASFETGILLPDGSIAAYVASYRTILNAVTPSLGNVKYIKAYFRPGTLEGYSNVVIYNPDNSVVNAMLLSGMHTIPVPYGLKCKISVEQGDISTIQVGSELEEVQTVKENAQLLAAKVTGKIRKNLLDISVIRNGYGIYGDGSISAYNSNWLNSYGITDKLYFNGNANIHCNAATDPAIGFRNVVCNESGIVLSVQSGKTVTNVSGGVYALFTIDLKIKQGFEQAEYNTVETNFESYSPISYYMPNENYIVITANSDVNSGADFVGNNAIQLAIDSIKDATKYRQYLIKVTGIFYAYLPTHYSYYDGFYNFVRGKNFVHIDGGDRDKTIIRCELSAVASEVQAVLPSFQVSDYGYYQCFGWNVNSNVKNITSIAKNIRYPFHIDGSQFGCEDMEQNVEDFRFIHEGKFGDSIGTIGGSASGFGLSSGQTINLRRGEIISKDGLYCHNNLSYRNSARFNVENVNVISNGPTIANGFTVNMLGASAKCQFRLSGVNLNGWLHMADDWNNQNNLIADHAEIDVITDIDPLPIFTDSKGVALRIRSKSTTGTSSVRFNINATAFPILIGTTAQTASFENRYLRTQQYGYQYRDGGYGLRGEAIGMFDLGEYQIQGQYRTSAGIRLGNCTSVNKVLTVIIDGSSYSITFNKNYAAYTNAQVIAEIMAVIGSVADVDLYKISDDYFPAFKNTGIGINADTTFVESGMGIVFTSNHSFRKALNSDGYIDAICLDNCAVGQKARFMKKGAIAQYYPNFRFVIKEDNPVFEISYTDRWGISSTPGVFSRSATPKLLKKGIENSVVII